MSPNKVSTVLSGNRARGAEQRQGGLSPGGQSWRLRGEVSRSCRRPEAQGNNSVPRGRRAPARTPLRGEGRPLRGVAAPRGQRGARRAASGARHPAYCASPAPRPRGRAAAEPAPLAASDWGLPLSIRNLFLMEWGCHPFCPRSRLPLAANQLGPSLRARRDWGRASSAPRLAVRTAPRPAWDAATCPAGPGHLPLVEAERRPRSPSAEAKCSKSGAAAGRSPRLGCVCVCGGGHPGAEEDCRGGGVMRRGRPLPPPRPRVPAASRQAPPFLPSEGQVSAVGSRGWVARPRDLAPRAFAESGGEAGGPPRYLSQSLGSGTRKPSA